MKVSRLIPLMLLVLTVACVSCKKGPDKLIAKTWKVTDVIAKGTLSDSLFQATKAELLKVEMTFKDNKYTMVSDGKTIETGTYAMENGNLVVKTENGMNMSTVVSKDKLLLDTPDFTTTLLPK
ncbi:MAG: hypothetical protein R6X09_10615 [Bacteroidales bacterium]